MPPDVFGQSQIREEAAKQQIMKQLNGPLGFLTPQEILLAIVVLFIYLRRLESHNKLQKQKMEAGHVKDKNRTDEEQKKAEEKRRIERQTEIACEFFREDYQAFLYAKGMGRAAVKDFWEDEIIPAGFYLWLQAHRFLPNNFVIPRGGSTLEKLILNLQRFRVEAKQILRYLEARRGLHEELRGHQIKTYCNPELNRSFETQQGLWIAIDNRRLMRHMRRPR